jgi:pyruvate/2-oxoglutarate dehydrogenase complex dihydrolipoamide acyltransferase (E2) component
MIRTEATLAAREKLLPEERVVQSELNFEKWPIFIPSQIRGRELKTRTIERTKTLPNGSTLTVSVTVGFSHHGTLTAKDQRVLYALVQHWNEKGQPLNFCHFSVHRLLQLLKLKNGGTNVDAVVESLRRLGGVEIAFKSCFYNAETQEEYEDDEPIHILSELKVKRRKRTTEGKYEEKKAEGFFLFHSRILSNLLKRYTRPVLFDVVLSFTSDTAQLLYALVDRQLATKNSYTKVAATLLQELGLEGKDYQYPSARKRALDKPVTELVGKPLSSGGFIGSAVIEPTADLSDYKVVFKKRATARQAPEAARPPQPAAPPPTEEQALLEQLTAYGVTPARARKLVQKHRAAVERELAAFPHRDRSGIKDAAAWLIRAIERGDYSAPPKLAAQAKQTQAVQQQQQRAQTQADYRSAYEAYLRQEMQAFKAKSPTGWDFFVQDMNSTYAAVNYHLSEAERPAAELTCFELFIGRNASLGVKSFHAWLREQRSPAR